MSNYSQAPPNLFSLHNLICNCQGGAKGDTWVSILNLLGLLTSQPRWWHPAAVSGLWMYTQGRFFKVNNMRKIHTYFYVVETIGIETGFFKSWVHFWQINRYFSALAGSLKKKYGQAFFFLPYVFCGSQECIYFCSLVTQIQSCSKHGKYPNNIVIVSLAFGLTAGSASQCAARALPCPCSENCRGRAQSSGWQLLLCALGRLRAEQSVAMWSLSSWP